MDTRGIGGAFGRQVSASRPIGRGAGDLPDWLWSLLVGGGIAAGVLTAIAVLLCALDRPIAHDLAGFLFWSGLALLVDLVLLGCDQGRSRVR